jgi:hypothetical protein
MLEDFYREKKRDWKARTRQFFAIDIIDFLDGRIINRLILKAPSPVFYASESASTSAFPPLVSDVSSFATVEMPAITTKLPRTKSGNLQY